VALSAATSLAISRQAFRACMRAAPSRIRLGSKLCVNLGARASGLGQAANGVGKILGPLSLALIVGTSNIVAPKAMAEAVLPDLVFLAFCMAPVGLSYLILGVEMHGKSMGTEAEEPAATAPRTALGAETH
jgi:MFS transporter, putative metabolite:H+ symporter